jgi:hypothetical protein
LNVKKPEIHFTADPLLVKSQVAKQLVAGYWERVKAKKHYKVGVILQVTSLVPDNFWGELLTCLTWDSHVELFLLTLDRRDWEFNQKLAVSYGINLIDPVTSWEDLQTITGGLDLVLSTRLHGLVAAVTQGAPCYGLALDPKIDGFCLQWGIPFQIVSPEVEQLSLGNKILCFLHQPREKQLTWITKMDFWRVRALENQAILKQFVHSKL